MTPPREPWLLTRLFDLGFKHFVVLSLIRIVYVLMMVVGLVGLAFAATYLFQLRQSDTTILGILLLLFGPLLYFVYLLVLRLVCETLIVAFVIAEHLEQVRAALQQPSAKDAAPGQPTPTEVKS